MNIAKATNEYIENHPGIKSCLKAGLINYSALARKIADELGEKKESSFDAILIACRRFVEKNKLQEPHEERIIKLVKGGKFEIRNKVSAIILDESAGIDRILEISKKIMVKTDNFHLIQGTKTFTLVLDDDFAEELEGSLKRYIVKSRKSLVQITHKTSEKVEETTGFLNHLTSIFSENGVNIYEAMSSWTDTIFLINEKDAPKIFSLLNSKGK